MSHRTTPSKRKKSSEIAPQSVKSQFSGYVHVPPPRFPIRVVYSGRLVWLLECAFRRTRYTYSPPPGSFPSYPFPTQHRIPLVQGTSLHLLSDTQYFFLALIILISLQIARPLFLSLSLHLSLYAFSFHASSPSRCRISSCLHRVGRRPAQAPTDQGFSGARRREHDSGLTATGCL